MAVTYTPHHKASGSIVILCIQFHLCTLKERPPFRRLNTLPEGDSKEGSIKLMRRASSPQMSRKGPPLLEESEIMHKNQGITEGPFVFLDRF